MAKKYSRTELLDMVNATDAKDADKFSEINKKLADSKLGAIEAEFVLKSIKDKSNLGMGAIRADYKNNSNSNNNNDDELTHDDMIKDFAEHCLKIDGAELVASFGQIFRNKAGLWVPNDLTKLQNIFAVRYNGLPRCSRYSDYTQLAKHCYNHCEQSDFFKDAPKGICINNQFLRLTADGNIEREPLKPEHRQRWRFPFELDEKSPVMLLEHLKNALAQPDPDETEKQILLMQEIFGAVLFGLAASKQQAILFIGPPASGKSLVQYILIKLVPPDFVSAIMPSKFGQDSFLARLAGMRLNVCGDLSRKSAISDVFLGFIGGDEVEGKQLYHDPFTFKNSAAHIFNTNVLPPTQVHEESFWRRWRIVEFSNPVSELDRIDNYGDIILEREQASIVCWGMEGAKRLQKQGHYTVTESHQRLIKDWQLSANPVLRFLSDAEAVELLRDSKHPDKAEGYKVKRSRVYAAYQFWCQKNGVARPLGSVRFHSEVNAEAEASGVWWKHYEDGDYYHNMRLTHEYNRFTCIS